MMRKSRIFDPGTDYEGADDGGTFARRAELIEHAFRMAGNVLEKEPVVKSIIG